MAIEKLYLDAEMANGVVHEDIRIVFADRQAYAAEAIKRKWPSLDKDPVFASGWLLWHALKRVGKYNGTYEAFLTDCVDYGESGDGEGEPELVDPTPTVASNG